MRTDLMMIMDELHRLQSQITHLQRSVDEMQARPQAPSARRQAEADRAGALAEHQSQWLPIRARWPHLKAHVASENAFTRHSKTLEREPTVEEVAQLAEKLPSGRVWRSKTLAGHLNISEDKARACLFFLQAGGYATWVDNEGYRLNKSANIAGAV